MSIDVSCGDDDIPGRRRTELELRSCKSFDDQHRPTALWTKPSIARTGGGYLCLGLCSRAEQLKTKWESGGTFTVGEEAEVSNAHETFGEQMQQEAAQEFIDR